MGNSATRQWVFLICGILASVIISDRLTAILIAGTGLSGSAGFLAGFILYAILFFGILALIEKVTGFRFFRFSGQQD